MEFINKICVELNEIKNALNRLVGQNDEAVAYMKERDKCNSEHQIKIMKAQLLSALSIENGDKPWKK